MKSSVGSAGYTASVNNDLMCGSAKFLEAVMQTLFFFKTNKSKLKFF